MPVGILVHGRRRPRPGARPRARAVALDWGIFSQRFRGEFTQQLHRDLIVPPNITLMPQPPRAPELNPVENIWQFLRENWLSNRVFTSYENIVDHCCHAWNKLTDQPWKIMSIGWREWAHGF